MKRFPRRSPKRSLIRHWRAAGGFLLPMIGVASVPVRAQERLIGTRTLGGGLYGETITFRSGGIVQAGFGGTDTVRVTRASQVLVPITAITPLGGSWRLDVTAFYANGRVQYEGEGAGTRAGEGRLAGMSDVRLRASGRFLSDAVTLTVGANVPTGRASLTPMEFSTLRVIAAPGLAMGSAPVGAGASGTLGAVYGKQAGAWALAMGASYEQRGRYQPVAALIAGAPSSDFRPGGVIRTSLGADRLVGPHRLSMALSADVFSDDKLRGAVQDGDGGAVSPTVATVRLGPVFSGDAQLVLAAPHVRELIVYGSYLWRAAYARDGITADGSSGKYLAGGVRASVPLVMRSELIMAGEGRWHSGLGVDEGLPTAGVRSASVTLGVNARRGLLALQPYVRAQAGSLRQRGALRGDVTHPFLGVAGGLVLISRF